MTSNELKQLSQVQMDEVYKWVDSFNLTQKKSLIQRDFSDGVMLYEILTQLFPKLLSQVKLQHFSCVSKKKENWLILNRIVFSKLNIKLSDKQIERLVSQEESYIEKFLFKLMPILKRSND
jgi:hypothetical protein